MSAVYPPAGYTLAPPITRFNARFSVAVEHSETAYRLVPAGLSLAETISIKDTRKVARDNTVKYHWRVLQLLPRAERPNYADFRVDVLERADGELMIRYQGESVDFQEEPSPSASLWGAGSGRSPDVKLQEVADWAANSHLNQAQRDLMAALESASEDSTDVESAAAKAKGAKGKPLRHQLHRTPKPTQQARWEAVQLAKQQGLSLRAIARSLGMAKNTTKKYAVAKSVSTKKLSAKERAKAEALDASLIALD